MVDRIRAMPGGIRLFLIYAALILVGIALSLRIVVDQAIAAPVSLPGVVVMVLLAYTIFTITLVLQRKPGSVPADSTPKSSPSARTASPSRGRSATPTKVWARRSTSSSARIAPVTPTRSPFCPCARVAC
jgi:hypothetical protein